MPSIFTQIKTFIHSLYIHIKTGMKKVGGKEYMKRLDTCLNCDHLATLNECAICGCPVFDKAKMETEKCPLNKWK